MAILYIWVDRFKSGIMWFIDFMGLRGKISIIVLEIGVLGGLILSSYLLVGAPQEIVPPIFQFGIVWAAATLSSLAFAGARHAKNDPERRAELLRVARKFVISMISFILFTIFSWVASLGGQIDPNKFGTEYAKSFCFWLSVFLLVGGAATFVIGIIELPIGLKKLRE
jgi:hypothetical protein